jgi:multidrug efflux system membrane fusion protein
MTGRSAWLGRLIALLAMTAALGLAAWTVYVLDRHPRTHCANLFAYSAGVAPAVSGRIVALHVTNNQRVKRGEPAAETD